MSELAELLEAADDINQTLTAGTGAQDETELEQELEQLMREEEESSLLDQLEQLRVGGGDLEPTIGGSAKPSPVKSGEVSLTPAKQKPELLPAV